MLRTHTQDILHKAHLHLDIPHVQGIINLHQYITSRLPLMMKYSNYAIIYSENNHKFPYI